MQPQGFGDMGGTGSRSVTPAGKSGQLWAYNLLSMLRGELWESCKTGFELHNLSGVTNDIDDICGGSLVSTHCVFIYIHLS